MIDVVLNAYKECVSELVSGCVVGRGVGGGVSYCVVDDKESLSKECNLVNPRPSHFPTSLRQRRSVNLKVLIRDTVFIYTFL